jgi:hypothetical protein
MVDYFAVQLDAATHDVQADVANSFSSLAFRYPIVHMLYSACRICSTRSVSFFLGSFFQSIFGTGCPIFLGIVSPTAGRFLIDLTSRQPAKQFVRGEWFVGTAVLTSIVFLICAHYLGLSIWSRLSSRLSSGSLSGSPPYGKAGRSPCPSCPQTSWKACRNGKRSSRSGRRHGRESSSKDPAPLFWPHRRTGSRREEERRTMQGRKGFWGSFSGNRLM